MGFRIKRMYDDHVLYLRAMNPTTGKVEVEHKNHCTWAGVLGRRATCLYRTVMLLFKLRRQTGKGLEVTDPEPESSHTAILWEMMAAI